MHSQISQGKNNTLTLFQRKEQNKNIMEQAIMLSSAGLGAAGTPCPQIYETVCLGDKVRLRTGRVHEVQGDSADIFALIAAAHITGPVIWCGNGREVGTLAPTAVQRFVDPSRLLMVEGVSRAEVLWAGEQALRTSGQACVIIELTSGPNLRESRRFQIACEESGALGLILVHGSAQTSAAETRWLCNALPNGEAWGLRCTKNRKGELNAWRVSWQGDGNGQNTVHLAAAAAA